MSVIKTIGKNGQVSLGKKYAGRHVMVEEQEPGVWLVKLGDFVPDHERWLWEAPHSQKLSKALEWSAKHPRQESRLAELESKIDP